MHMLQVWLGLEVIEPKTDGSWTHDDKNRNANAAFNDKSTAANVVFWVRWNTYFKRSTCKVQYAYILGDISDQIKVYAYGFKQVVVNEAIHSRGRLRCKKSLEIIPPHFVSYLQHFNSRLLGA